MDRDSFDSFDTPGVTVGIPFHAKTDPAHFRLAVDSILSQTCRPTTIHLVQDGPVATALAAAAREYAAADRKIRLLVLPINSGLPLALNLSILAGHTRYYARMDSDDIAHPERLARQTAFLDQNPRVDIVGTGAIEFMEDPHREKGILKQMPSDQAGIRKMFHYRDPFVHPSVMFRRSVFARTGLYDPRFRTNQDTELWARALKCGVGVANLPEPLLYFRTVGMVRKRADLGAVLRLVRARYRFNTWSPPLNCLKIAALLFRFLPHGVQLWGYRKLR